MGAKREPDPGQSITDVGELRAALESRGVIGEAKGMIRLMAKCDAEAAFHILRRVSQESHLRVAAVASLIAESGGGSQALPADVAEILSRCLGPGVILGDFLT